MIEFTWGYWYVGMNEEIFHISEELKKLPNNPGVYLMHDKNDTIIYVGKAINLNRRVHSYFRASTKKTAKIEKMVSQISSLPCFVSAENGMMVVPGTTCSP